jgi:tetratricopeptide (TPR) repeat protein
MPLRPPILSWTAVLMAGPLMAWAHPAIVQSAPATVLPTRPAVAAKPPAQSGLDAELFYHLLVSEIELRNGDASAAYQVILDSAKRRRDEPLFRRAYEIALSNRAGEQALAAARAWRQSLPRSTAALEAQAMVLVALRRAPEAAEPLRKWIEITPEAERPTAIASLTRLLPRGHDSRSTASVLHEVLTPWRDQAGPTRAIALTVTARAWAVASEIDRSLGFARQSQDVDPALEATALLGLDLLPAESGAEPLVLNYLKARPEGSGPVRIAYARRLTGLHRYTEALTQAAEMTRLEPVSTPAWLLRGALEIEVGQPRAAIESLQKYLSLDEHRLESAPPRPDVEDDEDEDALTSTDPRERAQAYLMLAQAAEQTRDFAGAQAWLEKLADASSSSTVVIRRASLLQRQGRLDEALKLIRNLPESTPDEQRLRFASEAQLLREAQDWSQAHAVLARANQQLPDDADLLYEQAMVADRMQRPQEMESLLRQVIRLRPDQPHAYNALGYSLADRGDRLDEARQLIAKALELSPGDPFITDSLGWVEFRRGRKDESLRLLRQAYERRPDTEIGAHLGEVLWSMGQRDEARKVWRDGQSRDAANEVLRETLQRLKVSL